jgi:hypothetical protein
MKTVRIISILALFLALASPVIAQEHMIHTYWHQLNGLYSGNLPLL